LHSPAYLGFASANPWIANATKKITIFLIISPDKMTQYAKRRIDLTISLGEGQFGDNKGKDVTLSGLRISTAINYYQGAIQAEALIRIFGLSLEMINRLTRIGPIGNQFRNNSILTMHMASFNLRQRWLLTSWRWALKSQP
jgi:hypothetical protein